MRGFLSWTKPRRDAKHHLRKVDGGFRIKMAPNHGILSKASLARQHDLA